MNKDSIDGEKVISFMRHNKSTGTQGYPTAKTVAELAEILSRLDPKASVFGSELNPILVVLQDSGSVLIA